MAVFYDYLVVTGQANVEVTQKFLTSTEEEPKRVLRLRVYESTSTRQNDAVIRVYIERERIAELPIRTFTDQSTNHLYPNGAGVIELGFDLPIGQSLIVGHVSGATPSQLTFVAEYEIAGA